MKASRVRQSVRDALGQSRVLSVVLVLFATVVFPVAEGLLASLATGADGKGASRALLALIVVGAIHAAITVVLVWQQAASPVRCLGEALEREEEVADLRSRLARKESACRLSRQAFDNLNLQTCILESILPRPADSELFEGGLRSIIQPLLDCLHRVVNVSGSTFTLEAYFKHGMIAGSEQAGMFSLGFFHGSLVDRGHAICITSKSVSPASQGFATPVPYQQGIEYEKHLWFADGKLKDCVYFRRYAVSAIRPACCINAEPFGVLVLTSMQDEPFSDDCTEVLAFISSVISRYFYSTVDLPTAIFSKAALAQIDSVAAAQLQPQHGHGSD